MDIVAKRSPTRPGASAVPPLLRTNSPRRPWAPPKDFRDLARNFVADQRWIVILRGVDYKRSDVLMREHLRRWAAEHEMEVQISRIRDLLDLDDLCQYLGVDRDEGRLRLASAGVELEEDESPGMMVRFKPADSRDFDPAGALISR